MHGAVDTERYLKLCDSLWIIIFPFLVLFLLWLLSQQFPPKRRYFSTRRQVVPLLRNRGSSYHRENFHCLKHVCAKVICYVVIVWFFKGFWIAVNMITSFWSQIPLFGNCMYCTCLWGEAVNAVRISTWRRLANNSYYVCGWAFIAGYFWDVKQLHVPDERRP